MPSCKLIIKDEVNIKFEGLSLEARRKLANKLKFEVPWARYQPSYRLGRWDGTVAFFGVGGTGDINQLDEILPLLEAMDYVIDVEDHRIHPAIEFEQIDDISFQFLNAAVSKMTFGIKELKKNCSCGEEVHTDMQFPNGASGIFVIHDAFEAYIKE